MSESWTENKAPTAPKPEVEAAEVSVSELLDKAAGALEAVGKALAATAENLSNLMVIRVDEDTRRHLDMLVEAKVVKNRREGAGMLLKEGLRAKQPLFARIQRTQAQIATLHGQLRNLVTVKVGK